MFIKAIRMDRITNSNGDCGTIETPVIINTNHKIEIDIRSDDRFRILLTGQELREA